MAKTGVQRVVGGGGASKYRTNRLISADSAIWPRAKTPDLGPRARTPVRPPVCPLFTASQNCQKSLFYRRKTLLQNQHTRTKIINGTIKLNYSCYTISRVILPKFCCPGHVLLKLRSNG